MVAPEQGSEPEEETPESVTPLSRRLGNGVERAALRAENLVGGVNFRVSAIVLAWLFTTVGTAQLLPWWEAASLGFIALGAGILLGSRLGPLAVAAVVVVVFAACGASWGVAHIGADDAKGQPIAPAVSVVGGLRASLEVKNRSYKDVWGQTIAADGNDELLFRLRIRNPTSVPSEPVVLRVLSDQEQTPRTVEISFSRSEEGSFEAGPEVRIVPQSNGLYRFTSRPPQVGYPSDAATPLDSIGGRQFRLKGDLFEGWDYLVPAISAHSNLLITFKASYWTPGDSQLAGGSVVNLKNLSGYSSDYAPVTSATPGDVLQAYGELINTGFRGMSVFTRVRLGSHAEGAYDSISLFVRENSERARELGHGTVNAETESPISLTVIPGTTEVRTPNTDCSSETREPVADGISKGGLLVFGVGGFKPRDPCHGIEFSKYVFFKLKVD